MKLVEGKIYFDEKHIEDLKNEDQFVKKRYAAVARRALLHILFWNPSFSRATITLDPFLLIIFILRNIVF